MPLEFDSIEAVPESLREEFTEHKGADGQSKFIHKDYLAAVRAKEGILSDLKKNQDKLRTYQTQFEGVDPEAYRKMVEEREAADRARLEQEKNWQELAKRDVEKAVAPLKSQVTALEQEREQFRIELENTLLSNAILGAIPAGANAKIWAPFLKEHVKIFREGGKAQVLVVGDDGQPRQKSATDFSPMTVADFVEEMRQDAEFKSYFPATGTGGSGAPAVQFRGGGGAIVLSPKDAADHPTYKAALEKAKKMGVSVVIDRGKR